MAPTALLALILSLTLLPHSTFGTSTNKGPLLASSPPNCSCPAFASPAGEGTPLGGKAGCVHVPASASESPVSATEHGGGAVYPHPPLLPLLLHSASLALLVGSALLLLVFLYANLAPGWQGWGQGKRLKPPAGKSDRGGEGGQGGKKGKRPWEVPFFGAMPAYLVNFNSVFDYTTELLKACPTLTYTTFVPGQQEIMTANPKNVQHILKDNFQNYPKGPYFHECFDDFLGHGIFNSDGDEWVRQRKAASLVFSTNSLRTLMLSSMHQEAQGRLIPTLEKVAKSGQAVDLQDIFLRYTFDNICRIGFGVDPGCLGPEFPDVPFAKAFDKTSAVTLLRNLMPGFVWKLMRWLDIGPEGEMRRCNKLVKSFAKEIIKKRQRDMAAARAKGEGTGEPSEASEPSAASAAASEAAAEEYASRLDLLSRMIWVDAQNDPARPQFSSNFLLEACTNFVLAGRDTSALALTWLFWLLGQHPRVEQRMLGEILAAKARRPPGEEERPFSFEELKGLTYVQAAINEGLRLYPSVPLDLKYAVADDVLPDGTRVRKGARVFYAIYAMGRMESVWGPDAGEFRPERWLEGGEGEGAEGGWRPLRLRTESPFKFPAFNAGPRLCLGKDMAYLQMKSVITTILPRFRIVPTKAPVTYNVSLTLFVKNGLFVHVTRR